jgi:2-amino-4-hydroxy-6-hydroxymethyldihydropteridine diphosphokinase
VNTVYLGIGSNVNVETNVAAGVSFLREKFAAVALSPIYRSVAVGFSGNDFINLVARINTSLQPLALKGFLNRLEDQFGRNRDLPKFSDRTLDIDILLYNDLYLHSPNLVLPRTEILAYAHVLRPLAELAPELVHPVTQTSMDYLWQTFEGDRLGLTKVDFPL